MGGKRKARKVIKKEREALHTSYQQKAPHNRLTQAFDKLRQNKQKALIPFLAAGYPDLETSLTLASHALKGEADMLELGVPCADAPNDGPVIQKAYHKALEAGATTSKVFQLVARLRQDTGKPLILMSYYKQVLQVGAKKFLTQMQKSGADALIIPDLPLKDCENLRADATAHNLCFITMATPGSTKEQYQQAINAGSGFLYCASVAGVTGARSEIPPQAIRMVQTLRRLTNLPLALGFGISSRRQVAEAAPFVDGVIVGSALLEGLKEKNVKGKTDFMTSFFSELRRGFE